MPKPTQEKKLKTCSKDDDEFLPLNDESRKELCILDSCNFEIIRKTKTYVDKSLFIKDFFIAQNVTLITAPRRFGKSTIMNMLKQFLLGKVKLFKNLKIWSEETIFFYNHCKKYHVIHLDFGTVFGMSYEAVLQNLSIALKETFHEHDYLVKKIDNYNYKWTSTNLNNSTVDIRTFMKYYDTENCINLTAAELQYGLQFLSRVLYIYQHEKVFILIDDYDLPVLNLLFITHLNASEIEKIIKFLNVFMEQTLNFNQYWERILITASVSLAGALSGVVTELIHHYPFLSQSPFANYFGFTAEEVKELLERPGINKICVNRTVIDKWYDGYIVAGDSAKKIYSSWSILKYLVKSSELGKPKFGSYWIDTGYIKNLKELFAEVSIRKKIEDILAGENVTINTVESMTFEHVKILKRLFDLKFDEVSEKEVDLFLQLLTEIGYFNLLPETEIEVQDSEEKIKEATRVILKVPNSEIKIHLRSVCYNDVLSKLCHFRLDFDHVKTYITALISVLEHSNKVAFVHLARSVNLLFSGNARMPSNEVEIHFILYTLAYNCRYFHTHSDLQVKKRRNNLEDAMSTDIIITLSDSGLILELKPYSIYADRALDEIFKHNHHKIFEKDAYKSIKKKIYAGLAFDRKKKVVISYKVGEEDKRKSVYGDVYA